MAKGRKAEGEEDKDTQEKKIFSVVAGEEGKEQEVGRKKKSKITQPSSIPSVCNLTLRKSLNVTGTVMLFGIVENYKTLAHVLSSSFKHMWLKTEMQVQMHTRV